MKASETDGPRQDDAAHLAALIRRQGDDEAAQAAAKAGKQAEQIRAAARAEADAIRAAAQREGESRGRRRAAEILAVATARRRMSLLQARESLIDEALAQVRARLSDVASRPAAADLAGGADPRGAGLPARRTGAGARRAERRRSARAGRPRRARSGAMGAEPSSHRRSRRRGHPRNGGRAAALRQLPRRPRRRRRDDLRRLAASVLLPDAGDFAHGAMNDAQTEDRAGTVTGVNGPVVRARMRRALGMSELVWIGEERLVGEVIGLAEDEATIQVYEDTGGLRPDTAVYASGSPLSVELGPGLLGTIFDGMQRPLRDPGHPHRRLHPPRRRRRAARPRAGGGRSRPALAEGDAGCTAARSSARSPRRSSSSTGSWCRRASPALSPGWRPPAATRSTSRWRGWKATGRCASCACSTAGRCGRAGPTVRAGSPAEPLLTGQRIIDAFFPLARGGTAAIPGGFGTGKTVTQHNLAKWADARDHRLHRLRRARQRDDRRAHRPAAARGSAHRAAADGAHRAGRQHLQHARRRARSVDLHRHHHRRVLPRHGLRRRPARRLDLALGRGAARDLRPPRRDARRGGLPGLPGDAAGRVLRARRCSSPRCAGATAR